MNNNLPAKVSHTTTAQKALGAISVGHDPEKSQCPTLTLLRTCSGAGGRGTLWRGAPGLLQELAAV